MNKKVTLDLAKDLATNKFNIEVPITYLSASTTKRSGNFYEEPAPNGIDDLIKVLEGEYLGYGRMVGTILLETDDRSCDILPIETTAYSTSIKEAGINGGISIGDKLYIIAVYAGSCDIYVAVSIIRSSEKIYFSQIKNIYGRACAIKNYYKLFENSKSKQEYIENFVLGERYKRYDISMDTGFDSRPEQMLKYAMSKENYTEGAQATIEGLFKETSLSRSRVEQRLNYLLKIAPSCKSREKVDGPRLLEFLDSRFYKMDKVKRQLTEVFVSNEKAKKRGFNILLVGSAGTGKTSVITALGEYLRIPFDIIPLNGMASPLELEGIHYGYENSDAGRLTKSFAHYGTSEMLIGLDEIDKMCPVSRDGNPINTLYRVLLGEHEDKFLGCSISTANTIFIATANSTENLPEPILNRFDSIIRMDDYSVDDKINMAIHYLIPLILQNFSVNKEEMLFSREAIKTIVTEFCGDCGARDLKHNIDLIVRHFICLKGEGRHIRINSAIVRELLSPIVDVTPGVFFNRHHHEYSDSVSLAIRKCLEDKNDSSVVGGDEHDNNRNKKKLDYLLACRTESDADKDFDICSFSDLIHEKLYGLDKVIEEAAIFFHSTSVSGDVKMNLALCGGPGTGKTSIAKSIAEVMGYHFVKIPLNGIKDENDLRGFASTYAGSRPGLLVKKIREATSFHTVFLLDEIDKINNEIAFALLDVLDHDFVDNFLEVPIDFKGAIFIATANDFSKVPSIISDRFVVTNVDGYDYKDKKKIVNRYIIPKIEKSYSKEISVSMDNDAIDSLLRLYCGSSGIRDMEKAMNRIVGKKLMNHAENVSKSMIHIVSSDLEECLGPKPLPRGNFPIDGYRPGISKGLAVVGGNQGKAFAIETVLLDGHGSVKITGLVERMVTESCDIAITCLRRMYPELLKNKDIHIHFGEGAVPKDGPSAGVALFMSLYSAAIGRPIMEDVPYDLAYTGEISLTGGIFKVGGVPEKIRAACESGCKKVFIPAENYQELDKEKFAEMDIKIIPADSIEQVIEEVGKKWKLQITQKM